MPTKIVDKEMERLEKEITTLEKKLSVLKADKKKLEDSPPEIKLAILLHSTFCHHNHTDGCGWFYEDDKSFNNFGSTKGRYLEKAKIVLQNVSFEEATRVITVLSHANANY